MHQRKTEMKMINKRLSMLQMKSVINEIALTKIVEYVLSNLGEPS